MKSEQLEQGQRDCSVLRGHICPVHPDTVWNEAGQCPRCGTAMQPGELAEEAVKGPKLDLVRRRLLGFSLALMSGLVAWASGFRGEALAQMGRGMMGGPGRHGRGMMGGGCPMCGQAWWNIPDKLPTPKSPAWLRNLKDILSLERLSLVQYQTDENKYQVHMPYTMVIPQEDLHIEWISQLFAAYGLSSAGPTPAVRKSQTVTQAYEIALQLEEDLIPRYEQLINAAEDSETAQVLNTILYQSRMHYMMFSHALRMGGRMGPGMMGPGMGRRGR
ncbi:MAG: heavy metal-binding domain-containing protein [Syntrophobacterales bacterium]|jgi:hypothetical protein